MKMLIIIFINIFNHCTVYCISSKQFNYSVRTKNEEDIGEYCLVGIGMEFTYAESPTYEKPYLKNLMRNLHWTILKSIRGSISDPLKAKYQNCIEPNYSIINKYYSFMKMIIL